MSSYNDLDLSKIDSSDVEQLASKIETFYKHDTSQKQTLSYNWERNHLMLDGQQWLVFDGSKEGGGTWRKLQPSPVNEYIPRPVTNYLFDAYQTLKSYVLKNKPRITVRPNTQMHRDKVASKLAELVSESNWERLRENQNYEYAASCMITYGTVFKKDYWDTSSPSISRVPRMEERPITDPNTGQPTGQTEMIQAVDEMGYPVFDEFPLGDANTCIVEPYRIALDQLAVNQHEARWIMEYSIRPLGWIVENYDKQEPGYTGLATQVEEEKSLNTSMRRFFHLRSSSGVRGGLSGSVGFTATSSADMVDNAAVVKEYYERPSRSYPKGRLVVVANNKALYVGDSPYSGPDQGDWHPYSECRWELMPGRFWGKSPFDDACEIQKQINSIDSVIVLTRKTTAVPQKLVPQGSIAPGAWTGQPGQMVYYKSGPNGEMPSNIPASGVDAQVFEERQQRASDLKQLTGAVDILKGDRPPGVTAASALSLLYEVGTGKLFPVLDRWKDFVESSQKKQLRLIANKYREPRPDFIRLLMSRNKDLTEDEIKNFIGTDLYDNCNVVIEAASSIPKLRAAEHALLLELASQNILDLNNPRNKQEFLSRFGISGFDSDFGKDSKRAEWENDLLDNLIHSPDNHPIVLQTDNHQIHVECHSERTKEPSFMALPFEIQQAYFAHITEHQNIIDQEEQMQQMKAAAMGMPPQASQDPTGQSQNVKAAKPLDPKTRKSAIMPELAAPGLLTSK